MSDCSKMSYTQVDILRHGACEGGEIFRGSTDVRLNEEGWRQMGKAVEGLEWDQILCSSLKRCRLFAEHLGREKNIPVTVDERWREFDFGIWEGRLRDEVWQEHGEHLTKFFKDPDSFTPEGGDSYQAVRERVAQAWQTLLASHTSKRVLIVTHGGIVRTLHLLLKSMPSSAFNTLEVPYACISRWKHFNDKDNSGSAMLSFHNRHQVASW